MPKKLLKAVVHLKGGGTTEVDPLVSITQDAISADDINIRFGNEPHEYNTWSIHNVDKIEIQYS